MLENVQRLSLIRPVRLRLERPLAGPYAMVLRRPAPEIEALGAGQCLVLLRAHRLGLAMPLCNSAVVPFYGAGNTRPRAADFREAGAAARAMEVLPEGQVRLLGLPVGHVELPNAPWVSPMLAELSPWRAAAVERWRRQLKQGRLWLNVVRVYSGTPQTVRLPKDHGGQARVRPFRLGHLQPVLDEAEFTLRLEEVLEVVRRHGEGRAPSRAPAAGQGEVAVEVEAFAEESGYAPALLREWEARLRRKGQAVLYGPPGTGKTFVARYLAGRLAGAEGCWDLVQFHPAFAYEDFVQGLRPGGAGGFELVPGRFLEFCQRARLLQPHACALIIDEINRAQLPRVLGELMYLLEYRDRAIPLAGGGPPFAVPDNVFLVATMNTADRSIALVDQALRRRFAFIRLQPDYGVLRSYLQKHGLPVEELAGVVAEINQRIGDPDRELGCSFFLQDGPRLRQQLRQVWQGEVEPYLEEVFYDQPEDLAASRWEVLVQGPLSAWG